MFRKTYVKITNSKLRENVKQIISNYSDYKYYIGVVKGNAYGHGDYIVNDLIESGINYLAVSSLEEALSIRKYNKEVPILCLEPINIEYISEIMQNHITITVESKDYALGLLQQKISSKLKIHIKLDTGMSRLGFNSRQELEETINLLKENRNICIEGLYTHFATSGINDNYYDRQIEKFQELTNNINLNEIPIIHLGRSMTLVNHPKLDFVNAIRLGICMYGFNNSIPLPKGLRKIKRNLLLRRYKISPTTLTNNLKLETAFTLYTEVMSLRKITKGTSVGYGASYTAKEDMIVATLPIGYFDGIREDFKYVSINNKLYEIVGSICMDMTMIKVDDSVNEHDIVEIFGNNIALKDVCKRSGLSAYKLLTSITNRVPRIYEDNKEIKY